MNYSTIDALKELNISDLNCSRNITPGVIRVKEQEKYTYGVISPVVYDIS